MALVSLLDDDTPGSLSPGHGGQQGGGDAAWDIEDEYNFAGVASRAPPHVGVLVDAHRSMGRPFCEDAVLRQAILDEVCRDAAKSAAGRGAWSLFSGTAELDKEELRSRAAAITAAVLSGERLPPGRLVRTVDAVAQALAALAPRLGSSALACALFAADAAPGAAAGADAPPSGGGGGAPAGELVTAWEAARGGGGGTAARLPPLLEALADGSRGAAAVLVFAARPLPTAGLEDLLSRSWPANTRLVWVLCAHEPPDFDDLRGLCASTGGAALAVQSERALRAGLAEALELPGGEAPAPQAAVAAWALNAQGFTSSLLAKAAKVTASASAQLPWQRGPGPTSTPAASSTAPHPGDRASPSPEVVEALLRRHADELASLAPDARRARIRELVAEEMDARQPLGQHRAAQVAREAFSKAWDAPRSVEQRLLLEWLLVLSRTLAFCGDPVSLARACCVSTLWRQTLRRTGSNLAARLWKWVIRFGDPIPPARRWGLWCALLAHHQRGRSPSSSWGTDYAAQVEEPRAPDCRLGIEDEVRLAVPCAGEPDSPQARRRESLGRVLLALCGRHPALAQRRGFGPLVLFAQSVAEEAGYAADAAEAQAFGFVGGLLDLGDPLLRHWTEAEPGEGTRPAAAVVAELVSQRLPRLAAHLESEAAGAAELLCLPWLRTAFVGLAPLPPAALCRLWDCWLLDGAPKVFFRAALALLAHAEPALLAEPLERASELLRTFPAPLDAGLEPGALLPSAWGVKVTGAALRCALAAAEERLKASDAAGGSPPGVPGAGAAPAWEAEPELVPEEGQAAGVQEVTGFRQEQELE